MKGQVNNKHLITISIRYYLIVEQVPDFPIAGLCGLCGFGWHCKQCVVGPAMVEDCCFSPGLVLYSFFFGAPAGRAQTFTRLGAARWAHSRLWLDACLSLLWLGKWDGAMQVGGWAHQSERCLWSQGDLYWEPPRLCPAWGVSALSPRSESKGKM